MLNPYTQAWQNGQSNSNSQNCRPSIFGALPYSTPDGATPTFFSFRFTSFNPNVLNCVILGPQSRPYFRIVTDTPLPGVSVLQSSNGQNVALVQWHRHPEIEIRGVVNRQRTSAALSLSRDQTSRSMTVNRTTMTFVPHSQTDILGRISRAQDSIHLELTGEAIHSGLLESAVMAAFLLQCGRNID
ncbi:hypothetical protein FB45DRAFT_750882 [Roridomyces roridus]|uniref:Uncharacterized protein n=1 Tax=Roridomyces roridus TaxID=1738132 RepID=A0AAD7BMV3_9AGAR|nr:hypothetical protein FB45DRAFT_750882 [Roridomyces roridus]